MTAVCFDKERGLSYAPKSEDYVIEQTFFGINKVVAG